MNELDVVLSSRVRLARNYEDLPFDLGEKPDSAAMCVARTVQALRLEENAPVYDLVRLRDLTPLQRQGLAESRKISRDLMTHAAAAAVLLREEESLSIMMNEEDHLRIQAVSEGLNLADAAEKCFRVDDSLSRHVTFAFDNQLGYLTACPTNTGTGMRASLLMHPAHADPLQANGQRGADRGQGGIDHPRGLRRGLGGAGEPVPGLQPGDAGPHGAGAHQRGDGGWPPAHRHGVHPAGQGAGRR